MKISCNVAGDLLPLYVDECCSDDSRLLLEEHLIECQACGEKYERMKRKDYLSNSAEAGAGQTARITAYAKKIRRRRTIFRILTPIVILLLALLLSVTWQAVKLMDHPNIASDAAIEAGIWNLTTGDLETNVYEIEKYRLHSASSQLAVHVQTESEVSGKVVLFKTESKGEQNAEDSIMEADIDGSKTWCVFTYLSTESEYRIRVEGIQKGTVTVSERISFPEALRMAWNDFFSI
jgi:hypothetical protein